MLEETDTENVTVTVVVTGSVLVESIDVYLESVMVVQVVPHM